MSLVPPALELLGNEKECPRKPLGWMNTVTSATSSAARRGPSDAALPQLPPDEASIVGSLEERVE